MSARTMPARDEMCAECSDPWGCSCGEPLPANPPKIHPGKLAWAERRCVEAFSKPTEYREAAE